MRKNRLENIFRKLFLYTLSGTVILLQYGCPYNSSYKIGGDPAVPIDENLLGKWSTVISTSTDNQAVRMIVGKQSDFEYDLSFVGRINGLRNWSAFRNDTLKASAFFCDAANRRFLNINIGGQYYIAEFIYRDDKITLLPLCEHFTSKIIKSDWELKVAIESHYKTRLYPLYDDEFSLKELTRVNQQE